MLIIVWSKFVVQALEWVNTFGRTLSKDILQIQLHLHLFARYDASDMSIFLAWPVVFIVHANTVL